MTESPAADIARAPSAEANSPAFLKAVTQLGAARPVVTERAIFNQKGVKLLESGVQIDGSLYDRLVTHRLAAPLDESLGSDPAVSAAVLREAVETAMARWPFFALMGAPGRARSMVLQAIEAIPLPRPIAFHLTLARETRPALFEHSVLMAILCAHLVRDSGAPVHDMSVAASAGLLHDLGMLHIDPELLDVGNQLSGDQRRPLYAHPVTTSMLVARFHAYPKQVARAIFEHHEYLDGSGYPRALVGDSISPLGRMLSLCEVVTAMFDGARERPEQRVSLLLRISPRRFDPALVPVIHRLLREVPRNAADDVDMPVADSIARVRVLSALLARCHEAVTESAPSLDAAGYAVLSAIAAQAETLRRMLTEAGITLDHFDLLGEPGEPDSALRAELWALTRELLWHLRSNANQLRRRWRAEADGEPFPAAVAAWLDEVEALDTGP